MRSASSGRLSRGARWRIERGANSAEPLPISSGNGCPHPGGMNGNPVLDAGALPAPRFFKLLLWVHWRTFCARLSGIRRESPLLLFVLGAFVLGYLATGYWLFHTGLNYLHRFPLVGTLLSQRILFLIFGFFFVM